MWRLYAVIALVWLCLMPPLFTAGACTEEFDDASRQVARDAMRLRTPEAAMAYWQERAIPALAISVEQCRSKKPRFLERCGGGPLIYAKVPVRNTICRFYRDDEIRVQLHYDDKDRLVRYATDMSPFKSLPLPFSKHTVHWAR